MSRKISKAGDYFDEFINVPSQQRAEFIKQVSEKTGLSYSGCKKALYIRLKNLRNSKEKTKTPQQQVQIDRERIKDKGELKSTLLKYSHLLKDYENLELRFNTLVDIKRDIETTKIIPRNQDRTKNEATPIVLLSDWHFEETVEPNTINNLNEYNLTIAEKRWFNCIQNSLRLIQIDRNHSEINNLVLWLGGDFMTGYIHEELMESNQLSPTQAVRFAKKNIIAAIEFYLQYGKFQTIDIVCSFGNHGRTTQKKRISTGYKNSYEWMIYHDIADYFSSNKKIRFTIPDGFFTYIDVYEFKCRFWHGDTIKYQGGIGGLTIPLIKAIHRYNQQIQANYNFMGHYHQLHQPTKDCIVNGSGIGFNAYAQSIGAAPEDPVQSYCLIDSKKGMTIKAPIFC